ncbi:MAG: hypothetical protein M1830_008329 [Pleopsidium flavum]|nr:MAG: hypothetical protein M1830_008329 [Pleopsidium flavum]
MESNNGMTGEHILPSPSIYMTIAAFTAIAWYNVIELNIQVFLTFKRHRGLYFWSLLISSYGCVLHALGFVLKFFTITTNRYLSVTIITIGWYAMVTGQAVVLYSRLHLVVREQRTLRLVLAMIIADAICFHIPTTVLTYGTNSNNPDAFQNAFNIVERLQMTAFCIQEFIISTIYVYATIKLLRPVYHGKTRKVMTQLIWINLIIIAMDLVLLAMEYDNRYEIEATLKPMVYSIKLKLEFAVLNQLMTLANQSVRNTASLELDQEGQPRRPSTGKPSLWSRARRRSESTATTNRTYSSHATGRFPQPKWIPSLDRNCIVKTEHVEISSDPNNIFTNPAAALQRPTTANSLLNGPAHDGQGGLMGTTYVVAHPPPSLSKTSSFYKRDSSQPFRDTLRPTPSHLSSTGVLRSTRPSVSDWAGGPDEDTDSPTSSEIQLDPYQGNLRELRAIRGRNMDSKEKQTGMDFMTSALESKDAERR